MSEYISKPTAKRTASGARTQNSARAASHTARAASARPASSRPAASPARRASKTSSRARRRRARRNRLIMYGGAAFALVLAVIIGSVLLFGGGGDGAADSRGTLSDAPDAPALSTESEPAGGTATISEPATVSEPVITPEPTPVARTTPLMLPVFKFASTSEKKIAITVDDCFSGPNLIKIVDAAVSVGGKITVFPIGKNLQDKEVADSIRYAYSKGCEIENHTWSHAALFDLEDEMFALEIWRQNRMVSMVLGVDYQMHFLRSRGGDNKEDQRTHYYMNQMGYYGFAHWRLIDESGEDYLMRNIRPGDILLFHTNSEDTAMLSRMIPKLAAQGYKLVTLNELFGYPENEVSELTEDAQFEPMDGYTYIMETLEYGDYMDAVRIMQARLAELGYLKAEYNGYYGKTTKKCVTEFQKRAGLEATGVADIQTQLALMSDDAPRAN